jgi:3' exoribonuclease, RNase T-like
VVLLRIKLKNDFYNWRNKIFVFDVETCGKGSDSVILSMAAVYFDPEAKTSPQEMKDTAFFVKLDARDQIKRLGRKTEQSAMEWWSKQCDNAKIKSFIPTSIDMKLEDGLDELKKWSDKMDPLGKSTIWARGNLDQLVLDCTEEALGREHIWPFQRWRDVRTAVDFLHGTTNGYCKVEYPGWDSNLEIVKHDPVDDCLLDAMMLMYGVEGNDQEEN